MLCTELINQKNKTLKLQLVIKENTVKDVNKSVHVKTTPPVIT